MKEERDHCKHEGFRKQKRPGQEPKKPKPTCELNEGISGFIRELGVLCNESLRIQDKARDLNRNDGHVVFKLPLSAE
jgi:hypothetical protein